MYNDTEVIVMARSDDSDIRMMIVMVASVNLHRDRSLGLFVFDGKGGFGGC